MAEMEVIQNQYKVQTPENQLSSRNSHLNRTKTQAPDDCLAKQDDYVNCIASFLTHKTKQMNTACFLCWGFDCFLD